MCLALRPRGIRLAGMTWTLDLTSGHDSGSCFCASEARTSAPQELPARSAAPSMLDCLVAAAHACRPWAAP